MTNVQDKSECELAATSLGLEDTSAYEFQQSSMPQGCLYRLIYPWLVWHSTNGSNPSVGCGSTFGADTYACICRSAGRQLF